VNREALLLERLLVGSEEALVGWTFPSEQRPGELEESAEKLPLQGWTSALLASLLRELPEPPRRMYIRDT
jgi:hypothetical protein